jgi:hypothetical protein
LEPIINNLKRDISISEGKLNQAIGRKGLERLNEREKYRRSLKTPEGKVYIKDIKNKLKEITDHPRDYLLGRREAALKNNRTLKFDLLNSLKKLRIKRYASDPILRVFIPKDNGKLRGLGIPTLKDRTLQMLLKLVMEPYLEPLGDKGSFGYRPGRDTRQAVAYLHRKLQVFQKLGLTTRKATVINQIKLPKGNEHLREAVKKEINK